MVMSGSVMELKRYTGTRFQDAVMACLSREFDAFWVEQKEQELGDRHKQLRTYLGQVQTKVVDVIAVCNA